MGNLTKLLKENEHLKNQNKGLLDALRRRTDTMNRASEDTVEAIRELTELTAAYIGAICLRTGEGVHISREDIKTVMDKYNVLLESDEEGLVFTISEK